MVIFFSLCAAFFFGISDFFTRVGLLYSNARSAVFFTTIAGLIVPAAISIFSVSLNVLNLPGVLFFILTGVVGAFVARYLLYVGMEKVGVSIAVSLANMRPLFGSIIAVLLLGEKLTLPIVGSTLMIIAGAVAISWDKSGGYFEKAWSRRDLIFPILAGLSYGLAYVIRKLGLMNIPNPIVGVVIQSTAALVCFILAAPLQRSQQRVEFRNPRAWFIYGISGLLAFFANYFTFSALSLGQVVIVAPLVSLNPLVTLMLAWIFLRKVERVTDKIFLGALLIICGAVILSLLKLS